MATMIRAELAESNRYWISKHRHYELKHFCLQYPSWKKTYITLGVPSISTSVLDRLPSGNLPGDPTLEYTMRRMYYAERIELIEKIAKETDKYLYEYILRAVTEGLSYTYLKTKMQIPCGKDMYYDRYRRFFWLLSEARQ